MPRPNLARTMRRLLACLMLIAAAPAGRADVPMLTSDQASLAETLPDARLTGTDIAFASPRGGAFRCGRLIRPDSRLRREDG